MKSLKTKWIGAALLSGAVMTTARAENDCDFGVGIEGGLHNNFVLWGGEHFKNHVEAEKLGASMFSFPSYQAAIAGHYFVADSISISASLGIRSTATNFASTESNGKKGAGTQRMSIFFAPGVKWFMMEDRSNSVYLLGGVRAGYFVSTSTGQDDDATKLKLKAPGSGSDEEKALNSIDLAAFLGFGYCYEFFSVDLRFSQDFLAGAGENMPLLDFRGSSVDLNMYFDIAPFIV